MERRVKKLLPALKHGAYSATAILLGEDPDEFKKFHDGLITEMVPSGVLEEGIVANLGRLVWRKQHLSTFWNAERARERYTRCTKSASEHHLWRIGSRSISASRWPKIAKLPFIFGHDGEPIRVTSLKFRKEFPQSMYSSVLTGDILDKESITARTFI